MVLRFLVGGECRRVASRPWGCGTISGKVQIRATEWRGRHSAGQIIPPNPLSPAGIL